MTPLTTTSSVVSTVGGGWRDLFGGRSGSLLLIISAMWMLTIGARIVYPAVMPGIQAEFGFGYSTVGILVGLVWGAYGLIQFPGGLLADLRSHRLAILLGMGVTMIGLSTLLLGNSFVLLVLATAVLGAGTGILGPSRVIVLTNAFPEARSTAVSVSQAAGALGNSVFPVVAGVVMGVLGWRAGIGFLLPLCVVVTVGLWLLVPRRIDGGSSASADEGSSGRAGDDSSGPVDDGSTGSAIDTLVASGRALSGRAAVLGTVMMLGVMVAFQSVTGFLPTYFRDVAAVPPQQATVLFGLFFATGLVMQLSAGVVGDRIDPGRTVGLFAVVAIPGLLIVLSAESLWLLVVGVVLSSGLLGCFPPGLTYLASAFPASVQGTGFGVIRTIYIGGGALGPVAVGAIADQYSLWIGFLALVVALGGVVLVTGLLPRLGDTQGEGSHARATGSS